MRLCSRIFNHCEIFPAIHDRLVGFKSASSLVIAGEIVLIFHIEIFIGEFMNRDTAKLKPYLSYSPRRSVICMH